MKEWTDGLRRLVRPDACRLGADVVVMTVNTSDALAGRGSYVLYRHRSGGSEAREHEGGLGIVTTTPTSDL